MTENEAKKLAQASAVSSAASELLDITAKAQDNPTNENLKAHAQAAATMIRLAAKQFPDNKDIQQAAELVETGVLPEFARGHCFIGSTR